MKAKIVVFWLVLVFLLSVTVGMASALSNAGGGDWKYYKEITVKENSGKTLTDYQVLVELNAANFPTNAKSDGSDLRFEDESGKELNYWIEEWVAGAKKARVWVKVPNIPANGETKIKMYYGNPSAVSSSDGANTFLDFTDPTQASIGEWKKGNFYGTTGQTWEISGNAIHYKSTLTGGAGVGYNDVEKPIPSPLTQYAIDYMNLKVKSGYAACFLVIDNTGNILAQNNFFYAGSNAIKFYESDTRHNLYSSASHNTYYKLTQIVNENSNQISYYLYDVNCNLLASAENKNYAQGSPINGNYIVIMDGVGCDTCDMYFKNIILRKYTSPEPTFFLSPEIPTTKPTPTTPTPTLPTAPEGKIKAVWLYNPEKYDTSTLIADLKSAGINTVFLSTDVNNIYKYERFVKAAHESGIEVHAMILEIADNKEKGVYDYTNFYGDPDHKGKAVSDVEKVLDYNEKSLAAFDGINIDLEPYTSDLWNSDRINVWNDYVGVLSKIYENTKGKTILSADIPRWYDESRIKDIAPNLVFFVIMGYNSGSAGWNTADEIKDTVSPEMGAIRGEGSKVVIGIGMHEGFEDKGAVDKGIEDLYKYYSVDSAFLGVSTFKYETYSGLEGAPEAPVPTGEEKGIQGFEAIFAIAGLLAVAYLLRRG